MTIDKAKLFQQVSAKCGYIGEEMTGKIYYALLKVILDELRDNKIIYLPDWGRFRVVDYPAVLRHQVKSKETITIPPYKCLTFMPCQKLKKYIKK